MCYLFYNIWLLGTFLHKDPKCLKKFTGELVLASAFLISAIGNVDDPIPIGYSDWHRFFFQKHIK